MQILQWLFNSSKKQPPPAPPAPPPFPAIDRISSRKKRSDKEEEEAEEKSREVVPFNWTGESKAENRAFTIVLLRSDNGDEYIYSTLHLKQLRFFERQRRSFWKAKMGRKCEETVTVNCKVLPICDAAAASLRSGVRDDRGEGGDDRSEKVLNKSEGRKRISRMKELLKWAATSKSSRGGRKGWNVMQFGSRAALDSLSNSNSSKISFVWELGSYSASSNVNSPLSMASSSRNDLIWIKNIPSQPESSKNSDLAASFAKNIPEAKLRSKAGQWITTDSDFVVLEL